MRPHVSLCMIVKDGGSAFEHCLCSVVGLVDEIVVIDTGSTDGTRATATRHGAAVHAIPWPDSFAAARDESLRHARGEWAFWLDADEWIDNDQRPAFCRLLARIQGDDVVALMEQRSPHEGASLSVWQARLFRNKPGLRWRYRVHEQILPACLEAGARVIDAGVVISHSGYESVAASLAKEERNRRLLALDLAERPDDPWVLYQSGRLLLRDDPEQAGHVLRRAGQALRPDDPLRRQVFALQVEARHVAGDPKGARALIDAGLAAFPDDTALLDASGLLALAEGDLRRAAAEFSALAHTPPGPGERFAAVDRSLRGWQARHHLAVAYQRQGKVLEAEAQWLRLAHDEPKAAFPWVCLGELYLAAGRLAALPALLEALRAASPGKAGITPAKIASFRARAHQARREFPEARAAIAEWLALAPVELLPRLILSRVAIQQGDVDAAESALDAVLALEPNHPEALANRAAVLAYRRDLEAARLTPGPP